MNYIYHLVPEPMIGEELIPLNEMDKGSDIFEFHARKYVGRESLTDQIIPILNCKWNDVVQFSAINPQIIIDELRELDPDFKLLRGRCFRVAVSGIENSYESVIFIRNSSKRKEEYEVLPNEVSVLTSEKYLELKEIPNQTRNYWHKVKSEGGKFLWFPYIPHIFIKGRIPISDLEVFYLE